MSNNRFIVDRPSRDSVRFVLLVAAVVIVGVAAVALGTVVSLNV
jgi:hypothetical protein